MEWAGSKSKPKKLRILCMRSSMKQSRACLQHMQMRAERMRRAERQEAATC